MKSKRGFLAFSAFSDALVVKLQSDECKPDKSVHKNHFHHAAKHLFKLKTKRESFSG